MVGFGKNPHSSAYLQGERFFGTTLFFQTLRQTFRKGLIQSTNF
jgi:hypothetical protein